MHSITIPKHTLYTPNLALKFSFIFGQNHPRFNSPRNNLHEIANLLYMRTHGARLGHAWTYLMLLDILQLSSYRSSQQKFIYS